MRRPNFLFIITDQQRADHLGCYGNRVLRTPHIDALAGRGVCLERHYVAMPICMPNRATLVTGRMPSVHGVRHNGIELPLGSITFPELLAGAGYGTALVGKSHLQNFTAVPPQYGGAEALRKLPEGHLQEDHDRWSDPGFQMRLPYYGFQSVDLVTRHGDRCAGDYLRWALTRDPDFAGRPGPDHALPAPGYVTQEGWRTQVPEALYSTTYVAERTVARLQEFARQPENPFLLYCSFPDPHHPWTPPGRYWGMYRPEDIALPQAYWGNTPGRAWDRTERTGQLHLDYYRDLRDGLAEGVSSHTPIPVRSVYACSPREAQEAISLTYCSLAMIDDAVGRIMAELARLGLEQDTVVIFTSDHGDYMGDHQLMLKSSMHYQGLVRTPFIWADAALGAEAGSTRRQLTGAVDVAQSILARAEVAPADGMQGLDLNSLLRNPRQGTRDALLIEDEDHRTPGWLGTRSRTRTLVTERYRLSLYQATDWGELYDLAEDPLELHNLWERPEAAGLRAALTEQLLRAMLENANTLPKPTRFA
ncbi:sulfatase family protein [Ottowia sp. VDI28]|uniref:sulfatase family protein n=1 Tax=Ottowia sp. VDI28 TaxID=3133968 RepID=UPI003C305E4A